MHGRGAEGIRLAVEVQAGHPGEPDAGVEVGVRRTGEHLHVVAERDQLPAEVTDVDALATAVRLAAVGQQCDAHSTSWDTRRDRSTGTCSHYAGGRC